MTLRSMKEVTGFAIGATGGALGKVYDLWRRIRSSA